MEKQTYKYQLHTHTAPCSKCATMTPEELARALYEGGYAGAVLTNHFFGGNTGIDRELPWEDFVREYEKDYEACRAAAEKYGVDIIFGIEEHMYAGLEVLLYGIKPKLLYDHPEFIKRNIENYEKVLHGVGALIIQAHPFRIRSYITEPGIMPLKYIDGFEVYNLANTPDANLEAEDFAAEHPSLIQTSGADTHSPDTVAFAGIESETRITDEKILVEVLRSGKYKIIR